MAKYGKDFIKYNFGPNTQVFDNTVLEGDKIFIHPIYGIIAPNPTIAANYDNTYSRELGFKFTVGATNLTCNQLRWFNPIESGITLYVNLWRCSDGVRLVHELTPALTLSWGYTSKFLTPITLLAGQSYIVSVGVPPGVFIQIFNVNQNECSFPDEITFNGTYWSGNNGLGNYPNTLLSTGVLYGAADIVLSPIPGIGTYSEIYDISNVKIIDTAVIQYQKNQPENTTVKLEYRIGAGTLQGGVTWGDWIEIDSHITNYIIPSRTKLSEYELVHWKVTLTLTSGSISPYIHSFQGVFLSLGLRTISIV